MAGSTGMSCLLHRVHAGKILSTGTSGVGFNRENKNPGDMCACVCVYMFSHLCEDRKLACEVQNVVLV